MALSRDQYWNEAMNKQDRIDREMEWNKEFLNDTIAKYLKTKIAEEVDELIAVIRQMSYPMKEPNKFAKAKAWFYQWERDTVRAIATEVAHGNECQGLEDDLMEVFRAWTS